MRDQIPFYILCAPIIIRTIMKHIHGENLDNRQEFITQLKYWLVYVFILISLGYESRFRYMLIDSGVWVIGAICYYVAIFFNSKRIGISYFFHFVITIGYMLIFWHDSILSILFSLSTGLVLLCIHTKQTDLFESIFYRDEYHEDTRSLENRTNGFLTSVFIGAVKGDLVSGIVKGGAVNFNDDSGYKKAFTSRFYYLILASLILGLLIPSSKTSKSQFIDRYTNNPSNEHLSSSLLPKNKTFNKSKAHIAWPKVDKEQSNQDLSLVLKNHNEISFQVPKVPKQSIGYIESKDRKAKRGSIYEVFDTYLDPNGEYYLALKEKPNPRRRNNKVIAELRDGTQVRVFKRNLGYKKKWHKVKVLTGQNKGDYGYAHSKWLRLVSP